MTLRLEKFCCCCTTRTGALVIGTLGWILTLVQLFAVADPRQRANEEKLHRELMRNAYGDSNSETNYESFYNNIYAKIGYGLVALLICVLLIVGIYKKDKRFILPWLVLKGLEATLVSILTIIIFFIACIYAVGVLFALFFGVLIIAGLHWYFWLCIWSHYKDLGEEPVSNMAAYSTANCPPPQYVEKQQNMA